MRSLKLLWCLRPLYSIGMYIALQVELCRHFNFKYAKKRLPDDIIPIISANMDTIGTFEMAMALAEVNISLLQK